MSTTGIVAAPVTANRSDVDLVRELAGHEDERLGFAIAVHRDCERVVEEIGARLLILFEERFARGARGRLELHETRPVSRLVLGGIQAVQRQVDEGRYAGIAGPAGVGLGNHDLRDLRHQREFRGREELRRRRRDSRLGLLVAALQYRQRRGRRDRAT